MGSSERSILLRLIAVSERGYSFRFCACAVGLQLSQMFLRPAAESMQWLNQCSTQSRERVFHFWWNDRMDRALHEAIALKPSQMRAHSVIGYT